MKLFGNNPRLDLGNQVFGINPQNTVHAGRHQHYSARFRQRSTGKTASGATWKNRETFAVGQFENRRNLFGIGRMHDRIRQELHLGGVVAVTDHILLAVGDVVRADYCCQFTDQPVIQHIKNLSF